MTDAATDWYENYRKQVKAEAEKVQPATEISQHTLWLKAIGTEAFDKKLEGVHYGRLEDNTFYFTEPMVNQLMQYAYNQGAKDIDRKSFDAGYYACRQDVLKKLDAVEEYE